jgi:hypothetical protein
VPGINRRVGASFTVTPALAAWPVLPIGFLAIAVRLLDWRGVPCSAVKLRWCLCARYVSVVDGE